MLLWISVRPKRQHRINTKMKILISGQTKNHHFLTKLIGWGSYISQTKTISVIHYSIARRVPDLPVSIGNTGKYDIYYIQYSRFPGTYVTYVSTHIFYKSRYIVLHTTYHNEKNNILMCHCHLQNFFRNGFFNLCT